MPTHTEKERKKREAERKEAARKLLGSGGAGRAADKLKAAQKKRRELLESL